MGTGYTIDTPIRVAQYGISSVISIIDHRLTEQMREYYSNLFKFDFTLIPESEADARAKRITAYLNLVQKIVDLKFKELKASPFEDGTEITKYFELLSDTSPIKNQYFRMLKLTGEERTVAEDDLRKLIVTGSIDVNIMTKIDGPTKSANNEELPVEFNDAHAALRGFAQSNLSSSVVFSAGLNPRLYGYLSNFEDFFPDENGTIKKKVILKVSDYRSALIQGKFLAKKGIWVSEFRVESGLNCGGHAFATDGYLMGPILKEFNDNRSELSSTLFELYSQALANMEKLSPNVAPEICLTVQGGIGTFSEHEFLLTHEHAESVGWGSPFLLVPEAISIDNESLDLLTHAKEEDYYLSGVSPLGVPFNTIKGNSADIEKKERIESGKPGAPCVKKHLALNTEFTDEPICTASLKYQKKKIDELLVQELPNDVLMKAVNKVMEKVCLCVGLGNPSQVEKGMDLQKGTMGSAICPGPNTAYFNHVVTLKEMVDHIYGKTNIISFNDRPNMFVKELQLYVKYVKNLIEENLSSNSDKQAKYIQRFVSNLRDGISYYEQLFEDVKTQIGEASNKAIKDLSAIKEELNALTEPSMA
tara:strand:+ start:29253 stop:31019 length:1767 start_codon:yes stop_codon:yes gene_type:complete